MMSVDLNFSAADVLWRFGANQEAQSVLMGVLNNPLDASWAMFADIELARRGIYIGLERARAVLRSEPRLKRVWIPF